MILSSKLYHFLKRCNFCKYHFEQLEARRGGLDMLGLKDVGFPCLVESFPLLLCSVENKLQPLIQLLEEVGVPREHVRDILLLFPPLIFYDIEEDIKPRINRLHKAGGEDIGKMLLKYPWILSASIQENYKSVHSFFEMEKVAKPSIDCAVRSWPHVLGCSTSRMKRLVKRFRDLGITSKMLGKIIAASPQLLLRKPNEFQEVVSFMEEVGFDDESIGRILCRCPEIFASSVDKTLRKKLAFLKDLGIASKHLPRVMKKYPEFLVSDVDNTLLPRMRYLMKVGLSKREVGSMVYRFSPLLGYSINVVLKPKLEFLTNTMQKPLKAVVEYPRYFSYSLEKKIKPRFWVLKGRNMECCLRDMLGKNDEEFAGDYMDMGRMLVLPPAARTDDSQMQE
uniref:mTERF domain-containing protein 1, mitochondrial n=1 Tax=Anthurium amnicola TaxID=1678845 RepID=A0A1D1Y9D4_9ARAE